MTEWLNDWMIECHTVALMSLYLHSLCDFSLSPALMSSSGCLSLSVSCWMGTGGSGCVARFPSARWGHPWLASASHRNHQLARDDGLVCQGWAVPSIVGLVDLDSPGYVQVLCILASWLIDDRPDIFLWLSPSASYLFFKILKACQMLDSSLRGDNPFSCVLKYPELF